MEKDIIEQYTDMVKEIKEIKKRIAELERRLKKIQEESTKIIVKGGTGGEQLYKIDSIKKAEVEETEYLVNKNIRILNQREKEAEELIVEIEEFINTISDSRIRRMITFKYIKGLTWNQTAMAMGGRHTADSCRMDIKRFLKKN